MIGILCVKKKNASTPGKQKEESKSEQMMHIYIFKGQEVEILQESTTTHSVAPAVIFNQCATETQT